MLALWAGQPPAITEVDRNTPVIWGYLEDASALKKFPPACCCHGSKWQWLSPPDLASLWDAPQGAGGINRETRYLGPAWPQGGLPHRQVAIGQAVSLPPPHHLDVTKSPGPLRLLRQTGAFGWGAWLVLGLAISLWRNPSLGTALAPPGGSSAFTPGPSSVWGRICKRLRRQGRT